MWQYPFDMKQRHSIRQTTAPARRSGHRGRRFGIVLLSVMLAGISAFPVAAQEESEQETPGRRTAPRFGDSAPAGSGFVRVVNAVSAAEGLGDRRYEIGDQEFGPVKPGGVTAYRPVLIGTYEPARGRGSGRGNSDADERNLDVRRVEVRQDGYVTVAFGRERVYVFEDDPHPNPKPAQLVLYNLTQWRPLDLTVIPQDITALQAVPRGGSASIAVNPIEVSLGVRLSLPRQGRTAGPRRVGDVQMTAGDSFGIFAVHGPEGLSAGLHKAELRLPDENGETDENTSKHGNAGR